MGSHFSLVLHTSHAEASAQRPGAERSGGRTLQTASSTADPGQDADIICFVLQGIHLQS